MHITTYIRTYVRIYIRTYIRTYMHTYIHPCIHPCIHASMHTHTHTHSHTHTHIHIHIHLHIHIHIRRVIIFFSAQCSPGDLGVCLWEALPWPEQRGVAQQRQPEPLPRRVARRRRGARSLGQTYGNHLVMCGYIVRYIYIYKNILDNLRPSLKISDNLG